MTTVAYRDGVLAADTSGQRGSLQVKSAKLYRANGLVVGFSGNWVDGKVFTDWILAGAEEKPEFKSYSDKDPPDFIALVMSHDGVAVFGMMISFPGAATHR